MVGARELERRDQAFEADLLDALVVEVEVLQAPAHLLAGHRLVAELALAVRIASTTSAALIMPRL